MSSAIFEYLAVVTVGAQLEVSDIGECAILARDDRGAEYYLIVTTKLGLTEIIEYGPCVPDVKLLPKSVVYKYTRINFSEYRIEKIIDKFLNSNGITYAELSTIEDLKPLMKNMVEHLIKDDE